MIIKVTSLLFLFHLSEQVAEVTEKKFEPTVNSPMWTVFPSAVIAGLGVIFNLLSLSYFIRREHGTLGKISLKFNYNTSNLPKPKTWV